MNLLETAEDQKEIENGVYICNNNNNNNNYDNVYGAVIMT